MPPLEWACPQCTYRTNLPVAMCPACHVPLVSLKGKRDARRAPRTPLRAAALCEVNGRYEAMVLDLSPLGAGLEHRDTLRPGQRFLLKMVPRRTEGSLGLPSKVVWSSVDRMEKRGDEAEFIFRSGVEFQNLPAETGQDLAAYLGSLGGGRADVAPGTGPSSPT